MVRIRMDDLYTYTLYACMNVYVYIYIYMYISIYIYIFQNSMHDIPCTVGGVLGLESINLQQQFRSFLEHPNENPSRRSCSLFCLRLDSHHLPQKVSKNIPPQTQKKNDGGGGGE